ncbi:MAG TPA: 4-(cytidine 5'-diphospho)-2-C-methyl-D-erythritol kinase [Candidatus Aminicenantes bacterium]|nr:4-(cytidine 5'-diphospho)-2-C-methyl-D-erythritol kinase [Candidatus Aminicenantes bacterium]HDT14086.1 4-(cytidine 5'-diphospho)-2-C-methyl-D-erythritol kinase [Candidatus Aminicenantes bacterium]
MIVRAFAKINLGLEVVGGRPDGYHDIRTLFQTVSLADELAFEAAPDGALDLSGDDPAIPWDRTNLVHRAAVLLRERTGSDRGARIAVRKAIPAGRGLGGGSSDAAVTLRALSEQWGLGLGRKDLAPLARRLGADVPFFLEGGLCLGEGIGDRLTPLPDLSSLACLLAFPPYPIATPTIYAGLDASLTSPMKESKIMRFLETGDFGLLENDLERVIFRAHPELASWTRSFREEGALLSQVSGSGSAVYGLFPDTASADEARRRLPGTWNARLAATLPRASYWARLGAGA